MRSCEQARTELKSKRQSKIQKERDNIGRIFKYIVAVYVVVFAVVGHKIMLANSNQSTECSVRICAQCLA